MADTPPSRPSRPTPPHSRPFARPDERTGRPTPLSMRPVLFVPAVVRPEVDPAPPPSDEPWFPEPAGGVSAIIGQPDRPWTGEEAGAAGPEMRGGAGDGPVPALSFPREEGARPATVARERVADRVAGLAERLRAGELQVPGDLADEDDATLLAAVLDALRVSSGSPAARGAGTGRAVEGGG